MYLQISPILEIHQFFSVSEIPHREERPQNGVSQRQPSENSLVFQQPTNDVRGEDDSMPLALMILIPILSSGLILLILAVVCIRR